MTVELVSIAPSTCGHRQVTVKVDGVTRVIPIHQSDIIDSKPEGFDEQKEYVLACWRSYYLGRRAAGRTAAQAMADMAGYVVRG